MNPENETNAIDRNLLNRIQAILMALVIATGLSLVGCQQQGPVEEALEEVEDEADDTRDKIEDEIDDHT